MTSQWRHYVFPVILELVTMFRTMNTMSSLNFKRIYAIFDRKLAVSFSPHWLIMGRSRDWPDLWWPEVKIRNIQSAGTHRIITQLKCRLLPKVLLKLRATSDFPVFDRAEVRKWRHRSVTWPDMKIILALEGPAWMNSYTAQISASYPYAFSSNLGKSIWGGGQCNVTLTFDLNWTWP